MQMQEIPPQIQQVMKVFTEYERAFKATDLITSGKEGVHNANLLLNYLMEYFGGVITIPNIIAAEQVLGAKLFRTPPSVVLTAQEKLGIEAKKAQDHMDRDYIDSIKQQPVYDPKKVEQLAENEKWVKGQTTARNQLGSIIMDYKCNRYTGPGIDILKSEMVQAALRDIRVPAPPGKEIDDRKMDYIQTINFVRATISELPDYPRDRNDVVAALQRVREKFAAEQEKRNKPDRNNGW